MKKLSFFLMAMILCFAPALRAADVTETIAMKKFGGLTTSSYENVTKTGTSDKGTEMVAYAFNPTTGQVRGNKTSIAGASITSKDDSKNWSLYNTQAMPGAIKKITVTQTAAGSNKFQNNLYVALGTTNQGAVTTVTGAQKNTTGTATEFTFEIDETQGYTYFKLLSNVKFTSGSVAGVVVTVTYAEAAGNPDATKYTVTANVNDPAMGTVSGAGEYEEGKTATLTANANAGYKFVSWSNGSTDNPLKFTVTEDVEITANFEVIPPMTCAEAAAAASGATVVLNPFDVVAVVKGAGYIYIKDESGVNLIYDFNLDDQLKAGDHVEGFVGVSSPYNGLPELKPSVAFADLKVTPGTAPEPTLFTAAPTKADVNKYVKFENVTLTADATFTTSSATNATMVVNGTNVTLRNNFKLAATLTKDKAYNIVGFAAIYNSSIQVYFLSAEEYVAPAPCTSATPVLWSDPVFLDANADQWYLVDIADAVAAEKNLTLTIYNTSEEDVSVTIDSYSKCPADELDRILASTKTIKAGETLEKDVNFVKYLQGLVDQVYLNVTTKGGAIKVLAETARYNVNVTADNGTVEGAGEYEHGTDIALTATPHEGYEFVNWTVYGKEVSTDNPYKFTVTADVELVANFKEKEVAPAKLYLTPNANWNQSNARFAAYFFGNGETWVSMTKVAGETNLYEVTTPTDKQYPNVIFCRMNPSAADNNWNNKWNQTGDLVIPTDGKNHYTVKENTWDKGGGTWSIWPVPTVKNYVDITITVIANAPAYIKWYDGGDKLADATDYVAMTPGENNAYTYTLAQVDELTGVNYIIQVGDILSAPQNTSKDVSVNFRDLLPQVAVQGINNWDGTDKMTVAEDYLTASITLPLEAKTYDLKLTIDGAWFGTTSNKITRENNSSVFSGDNGNGSITADVAGDYVFTYTYATKTLTVTYPELEPEIEWIEMPLEISNLTTMEMPVGDVTYLQLTGRDDKNDADVMLFLNNYTGEEKAYEVNVESSFMTFGGMELTVIDGSIAKSVDPELGDVYAGVVHASLEEDGATMYVEFHLNMYALPAIAIELEDVEITVNEESAIAFFNATWEGAPLQVEVSGFEEVEFKEYPECWLSIGDNENWVDAAAGPAAVIIEDGVAMLEGEFTSFSSGKTYEVMLSGKLPVKEPEVVEPTYTENNLNTYAFGLESELNDTALVVTYRLNNSNADAVEVVVLKGEKVVATVPGTTTIGKNTVAIPTAILPQGFQLTWKVVVKGTSVEAPTKEAKEYMLYHPSGLDIDNNPENPTFGMLLINEGMHSVKTSTSENPYISKGFGAGIFAFTPSLDLIPNGDQPGYNGGIEFTNSRADNADATAYAPRRIRISEDGRIFVTSLNTDGNYLWEVNPANMNEWTPVFQGTLNDNKELITADSNFVAAPNNGFDVKGAGENLQLMMYSVNLPGITSAAMSGFRCDEYNLGTATSWATIPSKNWVFSKYAINYTGTQVVYDNEGGIWIASYRGSATETNPGLVHINAQGVEDAKLVWSNVRQAGIRFNNDFTKLVVAGNNGAAKKATVYTISKDANGAPVLTEETVIDMAVVGNNLNDFAFDYAGNLYACGNSSEKLVGWAMPYSGVVETPAASKYAFHLGNLLEKTEMSGVVKRALTVGESTVVLTHEEDGTANLYNVIDGEAYKVSQEGVVPVDPENRGSYLAISDIAVTEDGKLVANNYVRNQFAGTPPETGYLVGTSYYYIWDDLASAPANWFTSQTTARSSHADVGVTFALKGTSTNAEVLVTAVHNNNRAVRLAKYNIIEGQYVEPNIPGGQQSSEYYEYFGTHTKEAYYQEAVQGKQFQLSASPFGEGWIMDGELVDPSEFVLPAVGENYEASALLSEDLGKKYNGATYVTVGEQVLMVVPYANAEYLLAGVKVLDITAGLDAATEVATADLDAAVRATAAATAVTVVDNVLTITLVADATIYTLNVELESEPNYMVIEDEITNLVIDLESMAIMGGPSTMWQVDVYLGLAEDDNMDGQWSLSPESSVAIMGFDARFIDGYVYDIDANAPAAKAVLHVEDSGFFYEIKLNMTNTPQEAIVVVVEDATVQIDTIPLFGDAVDYSLKMTADWTYEEDGVTYPVLVEVPVYYPEATEPSEMTCTVTIGGMGDNDPWLGFGEGPLTITTVNGVVTAQGIVANPYTGVAFDVTVSGKLPQDPGPGTGLDNININVKPVKMIKNGMLIINKGGREFNAQGATLK